MLTNLLLWALFGALAGWIAGKLMGSSGGIVTNIILGIIGSVVGGFVAGLLGINYNEGFSIGALLVAIAGACIVIWIVRLLRKSA
ncbi:MAG: GlsB/YeaQ/YmgE family stress response membrane protein [Clostridiales bacterium]|nr:GlsB/YeaQ/YmgE family stress response membrane protein [Clostridiales bacterium]